MTQQVQCAGELTIGYGNINAFKNLIPSFIEAVQKNEPDMNAFQVYLNAEESKAYWVEWYKNSAAILVHRANVEPILRQLMEVAPYTRLEFFGDLSKEVEEALKPLGALIFKYHGGFIRGEISAPTTKAAAEIASAWNNGSIRIQSIVELTISDGKIEEFKKIIAAIIETVQNNEPGTNAFQVYLNADETKAYLAEWYKNSESVLAHWVNVAQKIPEILATARYSRLEIFGNLTKAIEDNLKPLSASIYKYYGGFIQGEIITPRTEVPDEIVGAWENGSIDFELWENYQQGQYAGPDAVNVRETMVFNKNGIAKYYRYELAQGLSEELIDCTGTVTFNEDATFTFYPVEGHRRFYDTRDANNNTDTALTTTDLADPRLALTRGYVFKGASDPEALQITVAGSEPFNWYRKPFIPPRTAVPDELVGSWADGSFDFELWENYKQGYWSGKYAAPVREAMVFSKIGDAKYYRYETLYVFYEVLIDCTGTVTFNGDGTFTFYPVQGRKRYYDTRDSSRNYDRPLTNTELTENKLAGTRGYAYDGSADPPVIRITVPSSPPYNWYKRS